jgi:hypothetical protein
MFYKLGRDKLNDNTKTITKQKTKREKTKSENH